MLLRSDIQKQSVQFMTYKLQIDSKVLSTNLDSITLVSLNYKMHL